VTLLERKRACDAGAANAKPSWPPPGIWWVTRDSSPVLDGGLDDCVDVWIAAPTRLLDGSPRGSAYWMSGRDLDAWDLSTRWGRYTAASMRAWLGVIPDTDLECIRVGR
jgi:hypothetical protein